MLQENKNCRANCPIIVNLIHSDNVIKDKQKKSPKFKQNKIFPSIYSLIYFFPENKLTIVNICCLDSNGSDKESIV